MPAASPNDAASPRPSGLALVAALGAGCGGPPPAELIYLTPAPSGKARLDCPTGDALTATARKHFDGAVGAVGAHCVAVYLDRPRWVLDGWHHPSTADGVALVTALVDPVTDTAVWVDGAHEFGFPAGTIERAIGPGLAAVDLDGDGRDELVNVTGAAAHGYESLALTVFTIGPTSLIPAGQVPLRDDRRGLAPGPGSERWCATEWTLVAGPDGRKDLALIVTGGGHPDDGCLPLGRHVLRWTGVGLTEVE